MAIVVYRCDTCKRSVEIPRNIKGIETVHRCTITLGCRGKLYQSALHQDYIRASIPDDVSGLDNWHQRKVLYNHEQTIENHKWVIVHGLGTNPSVSVFVNRPTADDPNHREEIIPTNIEIVDSDQIILIFDRPWSGIAQLVARSSDPQLLTPSAATTVQQTTPNVQISNNSSITLAVAASSLDDVNATKVVLELEYITNTGATSRFVYTSNASLSVNSPWFGVDRVVIKGRVFRVREFSGLVPELVTGIIPNGTFFRVRALDLLGDADFERYVDPSEAQEQGKEPLNPNQVVILLASEPFQSVDKIQDRYIDVTSVTLSKNQRGFYYDKLEFFASPDVVQSVYPPIRIV